MRLRRVSVLFFAILVVSSCDIEERSRTVYLPPPMTDDLVIADCYVVRDALEAFAAENDSVYPSRLTDRTDAGNEFITFLPGGVRLTNRYTGLATGPLFYDPQWPGEIGVVVFSTPTSPLAAGPPRGYRIVGRGRDGELIALTNLGTVSPEVAAKYDSVVANCDAVAHAAELFAQIAGQYPWNVGADPLPSGDTLTDLLPDGWLLTNPFSNLADSPVDGDPTGTPGLVGYTPQDPNGDGILDGFVIDAVGANAITYVARRTRDSDEDFQTRFWAGLSRAAVEEFTSLNDGVYPYDIDTDRTPSGETLREVLSRRCYLSCQNPYTGAPALRNGLATSRGEVGYLPLESNGVVTGYIINALGLFDVELERIEVTGN